MSKLDNERLSRLIEIVGKAESNKKPISSQKELAYKIGVTQSAISKIIDKSHGRIKKDGKYYRLSSAIQQEQHQVLLEDLFAEMNSLVMEISPFTLAVKIDPLRYTTIRESVKHFFGQDCFGIFGAEDMMIVILKSTCARELIEVFKQLTESKNE